MTTDPVLFLAAARAQELRADARRHALVRLATCCRPSAVRTALAATADRVRRVVVRRDVCCA